MSRMTGMMMADRVNVWSMIVLVEAVLVEDE